MMDPTMRGDIIAQKVRAYYEANRETWWERRRPRAFWRLGTADNFMLDLIAAVERAERETPR